MIFWLENVRVKTCAYARATHSFLFVWFGMSLSWSGELTPLRKRLCSFLQTASVCLALFSSEQSIHTPMYRVTCLHRACRPLDQSMQRPFQSSSKFKQKEIQQSKLCACCNIRSQHLDGMLCLCLLRSLHFIACAIKECIFFSLFW